jgi:asparagine synthase (glutamine-hydrolysing)
MCGIAGFYSSRNSFSEAQLKSMTSVIAHRGPDSDGFYVNQSVGLGHKRLSIIDLSENGKQPMTSHDGRYVMVYNGEVYNYREISAELQEHLHQPISFASSSDSEVILEAFVKWGTKFVHKLNGMFAIAIYDNLRDELFIFRDRLGIKPLYYYYKENEFLFASELKSIRTIKEKNLSINQDAIYQFLHLGFIPNPKTIYNDIYKLEPGHFLRVNEKGIEKQKYWSLNHTVTNTVITSEKEATVKVSELLASSIQYQLNSDVPFGIFLSGGIDSSLITAQASSISSTKVNTFSIGFKENKFNESDHARKVADYFKTNHHEFIVSHNDAIELIDKIIDVYDEPFADSSAIPTMLVSKLAKQHVTVALSGEGGDELFFGYGAYRWAERLNNPLVYGSRKILKSVFENSPNYRYKRISNLFDFENPEELYSHIFSQEQYMFSQNELSKLLSNYSSSNNLFSWSLSATELARKLSPMERQAIFDIQHYLPGDLLTKIDRASMAYSLETRVPYLDHRLVEAALNISPSLKFKNGVSKYILKEILFQYIPKKFFDRPKQGFAIPLSQWLKSELRYLIEDTLNPTIITNYGIVNPEMVADLKKRFFAGEDYLYSRLWLLIILHKWLIKFG